MSLFRYEGSQSATAAFLPQMDLNHKDIYNTTVNSLNNKTTKQKQANVV